MAASFHSPLAVHLRLQIPFRGHLEHIASGFGRERDATCRLAVHVAFFR